MKIILSRKGFDSDFGGMPSPILPDGTMLSLPIPDFDNSHTYGELRIGNQSYKDIMSQLSPHYRYHGKKYKLSTQSTCHLDPDLRPETIKRQSDWLPAFGQTGAAQSHLDNHGVSQGDLFLFFGTFQKTIYVNNKLQFDTNDTPKHIIFGYFQIEKKLRVNESRLPKWLHYHPHVSQSRDYHANNTIYIAAKNLSFAEQLCGAGVFSFAKKFILSASGKPKSYWRLPNAFQKTTISYHTDKSWKKGLLKSVGRGQEFVVDFFDNKSINVVISLFFR